MNFAQHVHYMDDIIFCMHETPNHKSLWNIPNLVINKFFKRCLNLIKISSKWRPNEFGFLHIFNNHSIITFLLIITTSLFIYHVVNEISVLYNFMLSHNCSSIELFFF